LRAILQHFNQQILETMLCVSIRVGRRAIM